ncbi:hypothetical protein G6F56_002636 [Rhizopus delemar]|nr:hypothetical protein G6F56_002636 [Rhizopus delemar]
MSAELAVVYAALILEDDNIEITADKLQTLVAAAGVEVEPIWFNLYAKALAGQDLKALLLNVGAPGAGAAAGAAAGGAAASSDAPAEEAKEEEKEESDDDMGFAYDTLPYSKPEVERVTRLAALLAKKQSPPGKIHSVDKANVLATSRLWRKTVTETMEKEFPELGFDHQLVDSCAMAMVQRPTSLNGVVLTENMFGDILSDEASVIVGSLGLLPSASLSGLPDGKGKCLGVYEPIHGSAPDIAGQGIANPIATILSAAMLLRYSLGFEAEAVAVEEAVRKVLESGIYTRDLQGDKSTVEVGSAVCKELAALLQAIN